MYYILRSSVSLSAYYCLIAIFIIVLVKSWYALSMKYKKCRKYPPGPLICWPIIGNRLMVNRLSKKLGSLSNALWHLSKQYKAEVLGLTISGNYTVVIFGERLIKKVLLAKEYQSRPVNYFSSLRSFGTNKGITMTDGHLWEEQRAFLVKQLGDLGLGGETMNFLIEIELRNLINDLGEGGNNVNISKMLNKRTINVLWHLVAGKTLDGDHRISRLIDLMNERLQAFDIIGGLLTHLPWIRFLIPEASGYKILTEVNSQLHTILSNTINEHKQTYKEGVTRDLIDSFLYEMFKNNKDTTFTDDQLLMMCLDLFVAGLQTTTHTLEFCLIRMINHQDVQANIHKELDSAIPPNRLPSMQDRINMPYINAVVLEVMRLSHVVPLYGPRRVLMDTELDGYLIPKDATVLMHTDSMRIHGEKWENPYEFNPERFLNKADREKHQFYPFGNGKRRCPGEVLARSFIFLFLTGFLYFFKIENIEGQPLPSIAPVPGISNSPNPYRVKLSRRRIYSAT